MRFRLGALWHHRDFLKLWASATVAQFGYHISFLVLPLVAVLVLDATPIQMGILTAVSGMPALFGLLAGSWVDRHRRRLILAWANWSRAILLLAVPTAAWLGLLSIELLYVVAFGLGGLGLLYYVAHRSFLPSLVSRTQIVEANSKLEIGRSAAEVAGPGAGGALLQAVSAPVALVVNAAAFAVSALFLHTIALREPEPRQPERTSVWSDSYAGLRLLAANPVLRALAVSAGILGLFNALLEAVVLLYIARQLGLSPGLIGLVFSVGSVGLFVGALLAERMARWIGFGPSIIAGVILLAIGDLVIPLAQGPVFLVVVLLALAQFLFGAGITAYNVARVSVRQLMTPDQFQGRVNATMRVVALAAVPVGALTGGFLGDAIGLRLTLFLAVGGEFLAAIFLLFTPVRTLRQVPAASG